MVRRGFLSAIVASLFVGKSLKASGPQLQKPVLVLDHTSAKSYFKSWDAKRLATLQMGWEETDGGRRTLSLFIASNQPVMDKREIRVGGTSVNMQMTPWNVAYHYVTDGVIEYRFGGSYVVQPGSHIRTEFMFYYDLNS